MQCCTWRQSSCLALSYIYVSERYCLFAYGVWLGCHQCNHPRRTEKCWPVLSPTCVPVMRPYGTCQIFGTIFFRLAAWPSKVFSRGRLPAWWRTAFSPACCWSSFPGIILDLLEYLCHHLVLFVDTVLLSSGHTGSITIQERSVAAICLFSKQRKALISGMRLACRVASFELSEH